MKKAELLNIPKDEKALQKMETRLQVLKSKAYSPNTPHIYAAQIGSGGKSANPLIDQVIDLETNIKKQRADIDRRKERAARIFRRLDYDHRQIMALYYIAGLSWQEIADCMALAPASIYRKRNEAIDELLRPIQKATK